MIFMRDFITRENHRQIASLVTQKIVIHGNSYIILYIIGSDNGLLPCRRQAIIWTNAGILLIGHLVTKLSEIFIRINTFSFKKTHLKM